jgi:hypothetical protein
MELLEPAVIKRLPSGVYVRNVGPCGSIHLECQSRSEYEYDTLTSGPTAQSLLNYSGHFSHMRMGSVVLLGAHLN